MHKEAAAAECMRMNVAMHKKLMNNDLLSFAKIP